MNTGLQDATAKQVIKDLQIANVAAKDAYACADISPCFSSCISSVAFAFGALMPLLPWILNVYVLRYTLDVLNQVYFMLTVVVICVYICGTFIELHFKFKLKGIGSLNPFLMGFKHFACVTLAAGLGMCIGFGMNYSLNL